MALFDAQSAKAFTKAANTAGGLDQGEVNLAVLSRSNQGWDAPLPPPQKIDFEGIIAEAKADMDSKFADLPELRGYWDEPVARSGGTPSFMQPTMAEAEPQVFYPSDEPTGDKVSLAGLNRAEQYAQQAVGSAFNSGASKPLAHMVRRFDTNKPA